MTLGPSTITFPACRWRWVTCWQSPPPLAASTRCGSTAWSASRRSVCGRTDASPCCSPCPSPSSVASSWPPSPVCTSGTLHSWAANFWGNTAKHVQSYLFFPSHPKSKLYDFRFVVPCIQLSNTFLPCVRSVWMCTLNVFISPFCASVALCCSQVAVSLSNKDWQPVRDKEAVWVQRRTSRNHQICCSSKLVGLFCLVT